MMLCERRSKVCQSQRSLSLSQSEANMSVCFLDLLRSLTALRTWVTGQRTPEDGQEGTEQNRKNECPWVGGWSTARGVIPDR